LTRSSLERQNVKQRKQGLNSLFRKRALLNPAKDGDTSRLPTTTLLPGCAGVAQLNHCFADSNKENYLYISVLMNS